ncbi:helix-turn-helix domain-containing protein [Glaciimonas immobilis]|uniref:Transcriptional regulator with XRE-family HTH domain n=1 Tax=Glaciimonas immobilis TaxID=728004 RepID=A0A840RQS3_9BURK|nr:helix-turn-helix domain-containing protein [Glaciimonas immobilis]KAF3999443.1 Cro/Cl family transcriptional regulator [Glaciimonas immobilis]MBB5198950.1 transcriptional regulator with XRE-family HTH domain [Glaciimonas immobilis]
MHIDKYLNAAMKKHGIKTDSNLADYLGVAQNTLSQYRHGKRFIDNEMCMKLALSLDMDSPIDIIMAADADRAEMNGQKSLWEVFSRRTATAASVALLTGVVTLFGTPTPAQASPLLKSVGVDFILCQIEEQD